MSVRQIALLLNISPAAVSLALRDSPKISETTRRKVQRVAKRLGYRPSAKVAELMAHVRANREGRYEGTFGVVSLHNHPRPWEDSEHLARIYAGMQQRAQDLGYRLEPFWLREPGMSFRRFRTIIETRNIQGLLCLGSQVLDDTFSADLGKHAVVTVGLSIQTPLHRVTSHFYNDTTFVLNKVHALGYRRPGLIIGRGEEVRTAYALGAYFGWYEHKLPDASPVPVLRLDWKNPESFPDWYQIHRPDAIIVVLLSNAVPELAELLKRNGISVPGQLGVAVMTHFLGDSGFSGLQQNQALVGAWSVELLISRISNSDFGIPKHPRIEMVNGSWVDGKSL